MSELDRLDDLLSGRVPPGVYRWHGLLPPRELQDDAERAGWRWGYVAGWTRADQRSMLRAIGDALAFPAYYGVNLDALWDCLTELEAPTVLAVAGWAGLARVDAAAFEKLLAVLRQRGGASPSFAVLLWGEGPAVGVRSLD